MTPPGTVSETDQAILNSYLNEEGGKLYIESVNIGTDLFGTDFLEGMGIKLVSDGESSEVFELHADNDALMSEINYEYSGGDPAHYSVDRLINTTADVLYNSEDGYSRMFAYDNEVYKIISSSAIFAAFKDGDSLSMKPYLMAEIVNYFLGISPITDIKQLLSNNKGLDIVCHPNPFTESIQIDLNLENEADVNIRVFDELGRMINTVANSKLSSGSHTMKWNAVYGSGEMVETGIYFIHSTINGKVYTEKVLLTR